MESVRTVGVAVVKVKLRINPGLFDEFYILKDQFLSLVFKI
jgi:hypothetical protein